jgi:hypothetical protein
MSAHAPLVGGEADMMLAQGPGELSFDGLIGAVIDKPAPKR